MGNFKELKVWKQSKDLAVRIYKLTEEGAFIKDFGLKDQIRRASVSIPSNIAEGDNLDTDKQSIRHFYIARGSVAELRTQLVIGMEIGYLNENQYNLLEKELAQISAMLTSLIKYRSK
ncbi:MAG: four helix bundle protein [Bacteroidales bacterium]|jgi:four helix bundle protein|nr:four helix bundle protein [Bacteroidales bacterium]